MAEDINSLWGSAEPYENCGRLEKHILQCQAENSYRGKAFFKSSRLFPRRQFPQDSAIRQSEWLLGLVISTGLECGAALEDRNLHEGSGAFQEDGFSFCLTGLATFPNLADL